MGKSTCVKSILIALGLEAMLTTNQSDLPLPPAAKARLRSDDHEYDVLESEVFLEIENASGRRIVTQRTIKGTRDKNLITVHDGPVLTSPNTAAPTSDFFVNRSGAATHELGFHRFLAEFLGWDLPMVQTYDGAEYPLYVQCIFPYFVVEQTRGWSSVQPPLPGHFRIRDSHKRAVEFLLKLDAHHVALRRQEIILEKARIEADWAARAAQVAEIGATAAAVVQALPRTPTSSWPPQVPPSLVLPVGQGWLTLVERTATQQDELARLVDQEIPRVQEIVSSAQAELDRAERKTRTRQTLLSRLFDAFESERQEVLRIEKRFSSQKVGDVSL
jgi:hypothetical protein